MIDGRVPRDGRRDAGERTRQWGDLAVLAVERLSATVEDMHQAIAQPWFRLAGPVGKRLGAPYADATARVYRSVRTIARGAGRVSSLVPGNATLEQSPRSDAVQAFANAVWGDELARRRSSVSIDMAVRTRHGVAVPLDQASVAEAFPAPSGRVVVLLHGLGQTERCFERDGGSPGLTDGIEASDSTPVLVRYNSGRPVAGNGRALAGLLDEVIEHWPVPVAEIVLVGYSMGGLVARAALDSGVIAGDRWVDLVRHVVTIAAPHKGSPIEKAVEAAARTLRVTPQTKPLGGFLESRSAGIRDLHSGVDLPPSFDGIEHHVIAAVVTSSVDSRVGSLVGDLVVRPASAMGRLKLLVDNQATIAGRRHFDILADPSMIDQILGWVVPARIDQG